MKKDNFYRNFVVKTKKVKITLRNTKKTRKKYLEEGC